MFTKVYQISPKFYQMWDLHSFVAISNCCNFQFFLPNLYPQKVRVDKKNAFYNSGVQTPQNYLTSLKYIKEISMATNERCQQMNKIHSKQQQVFFLQQLKP